MVSSLHEIKEQEDTKNYQSHSTARKDNYPVRIEVSGSVFFCVQLYAYKRK